MKRLTLALMLTGLAVSSAGQAQDGGSRSVFATGAGNRALALGGAYTAIANDASSPMWNPAGLALVPRMHLQASRTGMYGLDFSEEFLGFVYPDWRWGSGAVTFRHFGVQGIEGRDDRNVVTGDGLSDSESLLSFSYARKLGDAYSTGVTLKWQSQNLAGRSANGIGADVGFMIQPGIALGRTEDWAQNVNVGISFLNLIEPSLRLDEESVRDPMAVRLGFGYNHLFPGGQNLTFALDFEGSRDRSTRVFAGAEFRLNRLLALRSGLNQSGLTVGTGVHWRDAAFNYAYESNELGALHHLELAVSFGKTVDQKRLAALRDQENALQKRLSAAFERRQQERTQEMLAEARSAINANDHDGALQILALAATLTSDPEAVTALQIEAQLGKARLEEAAGHFADASITYGRVLTLDPPNRDARIGLERCRAQSDLIARRSEEIQAMFAAALDAFTAGDLLIARRGFQQILELQPTDADAADMFQRTNLALSQKVSVLLENARRHTDGRRFPEAEASIVTAETLLPDAAGIPPARRHLQSARQREQERMRREEETRVRQLQGQKSPTEIVAVAPKKPSLDPEELEDLYRKGVNAMEASRSEEAVRFWELVFAADPDYRQVRENLKREYLLWGMDSFAAGDLDESIRHWERAVDVDPDDEKAQGYLSRARQQQARSREIRETGDER